MTLRRAVSLPVRPLARSALARAAVSLLALSRPALSHLLLSGFSLALAVAAALPAATPGSPSGSPPPVAPHSVAPSRCAAVVWTALRWPGGFLGTVTLTNTGNTPMYAWFVAWQLPDATLDQVWNGIAMVSGPTAMVHAPSWHSPLAPGQTVTAGFLATGEPPTSSAGTLCG